MEENFKVGELYTESFEKMALKEIGHNLEGVCYKVEEKEYTHNLSPKELAEKKTELAEVSIKIDQLESLKKEEMERFKNKLTEPKQDHVRLLETIKFKSERRFGNIYLVDDQEKGMMYSYDQNGMCVDMRPLYPEERQTVIRTINRAENG